MAKYIKHKYRLAQSNWLFRELIVKWKSSFLLLPCISLSRMASSIDPVMPLTRPELVLTFCKSIIGMFLKNAKNPKPLSLPASPI